MDIGTGAVAASGVVMAGIAVIRLLPTKNNPNKYVKQKQFDMFVQTISEDVTEIKGSISKIHERIDKLWEK